MYDGEDAKARLSSIYSLDYPEFNVVIADGTQTLMELGTHIADALAMTTGTFYDVGNDDFVFKTSSFMKMALRFLDASNSLHGRKAQVTFSSIERLAPMCAEPVGLPS